MPYSVVHRLPRIDEYNALRKVVGWPVFDTRLVTIALKNSLFAVCIENNGSIIGMGRIVGDDAIYLHIQDVIVHPEFQGNGVGHQIMEALLNYINQVGGTHTNIGLMCSKGREAFYKKFGFIERPDEKFGAGMIRVKSQGLNNT